MLPTGRPRFCLPLILDRAMHLAISRAKSMVGELAISLLGLFLWKVITNFRRFYTADKGSQMLLLLE